MNVSINDPNGLSMSTDLGQVEIKPEIGGQRKAHYLALRIFNFLQGVTADESRRVAARSALGDYSELLIHSRILGRHFYNCPKPPDAGCAKCHAWAKLINLVDEIRTKGLE